MMRSIFLTNHHSHFQLFVYGVTIGLWSHNGFWAGLAVLVIGAVASGIIQAILEGRSNG